MAGIDFYFEFASPYGYFASLRLDTIAANHDREVSWRPIMLGPVLKLTGSAPNMTIPVKGDYFRRDVPRCARLLQAPFSWPETMPMNSLVAARAFWWMAERDEDIAKGMAQAILHAHWAEGRDMSTEAHVAEVVAPLGIGADELAAACADPAVKAKLRAETDRSIERGVFGSPFVFVDDEPFWGADRLAHIERWLATGGW